jgi:predicted dehydrogenase
MSKASRREFLGAAAALGLSAGLGRAQPADRAAHRIGLIGCGWYGLVDIKAAFEAGPVEVLAICDVDSEHLEKTAVEIAKLQDRRPKTFKHYEELLDAPGLETVFIATPPQWHALPFIAACRRGLHIYCEKPLAYDVREGRTMVDAAARAGNVVQVGFQRRQSDAFRAAYEYVREGKAGRIVQVEANIHYNAPRVDRMPQDPPASLDWDLWCGPAPKLPYSPAVAHIHWRLEREYGHGHLVDWGIHLIDGVRVALGESTPKWVTAAGGLYVLGDHITTPDSLTVHFEFERCPVIWRHRMWGSPEYRPEVNNGIFFFCEEQTIFATDARWMIISKERGQEPVVHEVDAGQTQRRHVADFFEAIRTGRKPNCTVEDGHRSTTTVQLAAAAYETNTRIVWDAAREECVENPAANKLLLREYRSPWKHPHTDRGGRS